MPPHVQGETKMKTNVERLPRTAMSFYVKLYSKRKQCLNKNLTRNNMVEAIRSWLSLSKEEKQYFIDKHKECQRKYKTIFANYLKDSEPYMKQKTRHIEQDTEENKSHSTEVIPEPENSFCTTKTDDNLSVQTDTCLRDIERTEVDIQIPALKLSEPLPPNVLRAVDLFELIKVKQGKFDVTWSSLPKYEKDKLRTAVLLLKKTYIKDYIRFLENLQSKELFYHYVKNLE